MVSLTVASWNRIAEWLAASSVSRRGVSDYSAALPIQRSNLQKTKRQPRWGQTDELISARPRAQSSLNSSMAIVAAKSPAGVFPIQQETDQMKASPVTLAVAAVLLGATLTPPVAADKGGVGSARLQLVEATIQDLQKALQTKLVTSEQLVEMYHARMAAYEDSGPHINAYIHVNANADVEAAHVDARRHPGAVNGPLYGIPILLKDNIDTADMPTTAGSVALAGSIPPDDAFIVQKLREAGAIILGKATLTEFANFLAIGMPTGYSSLGGFGFNPYDPRVDPRTTPPFNDGRPVLQTGGSSSGSGIGVNANLAPIAIGTETSGSILSPANANGIVGIKPTVGLVSRDGIIPITADQDTAGPLTRTVTDAAILLGVIAGYDPNDPATAECLIPGHCFSDYTQFLNRRALRAHALPCTLRRSRSANRQAVIDNAVAVLRAQGASVRTLAVSDIPPQPGSCVAYPLPAIPAPPAVRCSSVLLYGFKRDLNAYLAATPGAPNHTLAEIVAFNNTFVPPMKYGQAIAAGAAQIDIIPEAPTRSATWTIARSISRSRVMR